MQKQFGTYCAPLFCGLLCYTGCSHAGAAGPTDSLARSSAAAQVILAEGVEPLTDMLSEVDAQAAVIRVQKHYKEKNIS